MKTLLFVGLSGFGIVGMLLAAPPASAKSLSDGVKISPKTALNSLDATYSGSVAKILNDHCVSCHRPGDVAPFSLIGYEAAKKNAPMIAAATGDKRMPPWKAVHGFGEFLDENRLEQNELDSLKQWAAKNAPRGDKTKEPKAPVFSTSGWKLGKPDLVVSASKPFKLEAEGDDVYRNFVIDPKLTTSRFVTAVDVRPTNSKVVHHVIAFLDSSGKTLKMAENNPDGQDGYTSAGGGIGVAPSGALGGWAPGVAARHSPAGTGFELKPGTKIVMQVHYHKSGKPEVDQTQMAVYFSDEPAEKPIQIHWVANPLFSIPAGVDNHRVSWSYPIRRDSTIYSVMPHMHLLGKSMKATLIGPDNSVTPLVFVDKWDFNWQLVYALKKPMKVLKGSKIRVEAYYNNSDSNPYKTGASVTWGEQTTDEMALLVVAYSLGDPPPLPGGKK